MLSFSVTAFSHEDKIDKADKIWYSKHKPCGMLYIIIIIMAMCNEEYYKLQAQLVEKDDVYIVCSESFTHVQGNREEKMYEGINISVLIYVNIVNLLSLSGILWRLYKIGMCL